MYFRAKRSGGFEYLQLVESHRVNGKPRQTVVATLGRLDALKENGELDRLLQSGARFTESGMLGVGLREHANLWGLFRFG
jgi:hypothetical protein